MKLDIWDGAPVAAVLYQPARSKANSVCRSPVWDGMFSVSEQGEIGMSFRGINTTVIQIRRQVFTEVARMAYANVKGEQANHLMRKIRSEEHTSELQSR